MICPYPMTFISAENIEKSYGPLKVLKGVDLSINKGEVVSIVGASGAGKSTLLHILGTLDQPDAGMVTMDGEEVFKLSAPKLASFRNNRIGFVFQFHNLLPELTALENVCLPAMIQGKSLNEAKKSGQELMEKLGLSSRVGHHPSELSGGEQQRTAVARALINDPSIILADEPSGNLDSENAIELHNLFFKLREELNQTFIVVTHNKELAKQADRSLFMEDGKFIP